MLTFPGNSYDIAIWSSVEVNTSLFCASAAAIKPLLRKISPSFLSSISARTTRTTPGSRNKLDIYPRSKHRSAANAIELNSQHDLRISPGISAITNTLWADGRNKSSDEESHNEDPTSSGEIRKTVSVIVTDQKHDDLEIRRARGITKFEHV